MSAASNVLDGWLGNPAPRAADTDRVRALRHAGSGWSGLRTLVAGIGTSGFAAADALLEAGAEVTVVDAGTGEAQREKGALLEVLGAAVLLGPQHVQEPPQPWAAYDLVVTSPGWRPDAPLLVGAALAGVPVWGEVELGWRMRPDPASGALVAPWLTLTGTNGKTTTVELTASILRAAGLRAGAAGNVGTPLVEALRHPEAFEVLAVELSSYQLHWLSTDTEASLRPLASAVLNLAPDHLDWHGSVDAYARAKGRVYENTERACVYNAADPRTEELVREAEVVEGARAIGFTRQAPRVGMLGVVEDVLADRAFVEQRRTSAAELCSFADLRPAGSDAPVAPHTVDNVLAAAALARAHGVPQVAVRDGVRSFTPAPHRVQTVAETGGVRWVDDSKATNAHAAQASLHAFEHVVWIAGGLAKGARFDDLVERTAGRLRAAVLIGADRALLREALDRHAPDVPVVEVDLTHTGAVPPSPDSTAAERDASAAALMDAVVERAAALARPGDTVLLAPACASMDQFVSYAHRGDAFAAAVRRRSDREG
ncbi:UDP-N-acetylmuramoyl-L-alanine--D-glutamate ligase [Kineococcus sp. SYSU DK018]|uniref:UDP-N-acetylmuramoyl-L-alanine--D-glutamate ligase n=1 Tax=Kineococcus sp. SYSU DK018 TaxID=3383139 RepID=UPI003D7EA4B7